ncbi:MAG: 4Fe-4S cluster-binding domain-containing protein [Spirochaetia bacterium]|jgi:sulfatase maturation enzyme AslB (radical SAM superfamily)|nr:4Fe-4S cluster-binding domain-containing protein [Spirochaetia bacterium]
MAMLKLCGKTLATFKPIIGEIVIEKVPFYKRHDKIFVTENINIDCLGYLAIISTVKPVKNIFMPYIIGNINKPKLAIFNKGDIVKLQDNGEIFFLWEIRSNQNALLITESCNCNCLMCPQPIQKHDQSLYNNASRVLDLLKNKEIDTFCIIGGEPTLLENNFINILSRCHDEHSSAQIDILTNGKKFADTTFTSKITNIHSCKDIFCVSLHSDIDSIHDKIVGCKDSYINTITGIYNLAKKKF